MGRTNEKEIEGKDARGSGIDGEKGWRCGGRLRGGRDRGRGEREAATGIGRRKRRRRRGLKRWSPEKEEEVEGRNRRVRKQDICNAWLTV